MKKRFYLLLSLFLIAAQFGGNLMTGDYEIATWKGFCSAAVTFTFDDGCANQFSIAVPLFNQYDFQLTLYPVTSWSSGIWTKLQEAAMAGHEVGSHTITHPHLGSLPESKLLEELRDSQAEINQRIPSQKCLTISYPYCETCNAELVKQFYIAARGCSGQIERSTPSNFMNISSIICGTEGSVKKVSDFVNRISAAATLKGWVVFLIHGINNTSDGWSPVQADTLRKVGAYLNENRDKYWVTSFVNVAKYIQERNCASITEKAVSDTVITFELTDTLDNSVYNIPLTVKRRLPENWETAIVTQNGIELDYKIEINNGAKYVIFEAIPDGGEIKIYKSIATLFKGEKENGVKLPSLNQNFPNPFNPRTTIKFYLPNKRRVILKIINQLGNEVMTLLDEEKIAGEHEVIFDASGLPSGVYFYRLEAGDFQTTKKLLVIK